MLHPSNDHPHYGLHYTGYKKFEWGVVGDTACADSWGWA